MQNLTQIVPEMWEVRTEIYLNLYVKYDLHCTDFHETHITQKIILDFCTEFYPNQQKNVKSAIPVICGMSVLLGIKIYIWQAGQICLEFVL
jgi:hypothetical protein